MVKRKQRKWLLKLQLMSANFWKFACGEFSTEPDFTKLLEQDLLTAYMDKLKRSGVGLEGRITKIDNLEAALRFIHLRILKDQ